MIDLACFHEVSAEWVSDSLFDPGLARHLARHDGEGRETVDDGDIRVVTTGTEDGRSLEIEPKEGQSLVDALTTGGGFTAEEAATVEDHIEDRS